jgi:IS5 family transposase
MIGKPKSQVSLLDSAFSKRKKRSRSDSLLQKIDKFIDWQELETICQPMYKASRRGRPTIPIQFSLKCLILQYLYNLSDPALEDALVDRLSFQRFLGISFESEIPDFTTIWRFRERLNKAGLLNNVFEAVVKQLDQRNTLLRRGTLIDATLVQAARRPSKQDSPQDGDTSSGGRADSQRDRDASSVKQGKKFCYGYKGHIAVDQGSGIIRKQSFTSACVHDSQQTGELICGDEQALFADKAYSSDELKQSCRKNGVFYGVMDKGRRNRPLSQKQKKANSRKSRIRNAVERPFAWFKRILGYRMVRYVNLRRNALHFTFLCIVHNLRRGVCLSTKT